MSRLALRLLLCLLLVLNGTGYAAAAAQMGVAHLAMLAHDAHAMPPCHQTAPQDDAAATLHAHADDCDTAAATAPDAPGCCQTPHCNCDCLQHATAAPAVVHVPASFPTGPDLAQPHDIHRASPLLPNLLRPPIA